MRYGLHDRPVKERVKAALHVLTKGSLAKFHDCVEAAYTDVCKYINSTEEYGYSGLRNDEAVGIIP